MWCSIGGGAEASKTPDERIADQRLAESMKRQGRVVIGTHVRQEAKPGFGTQWTLDGPEPALASRAKAVGVSDVLPDTDMVVRRLPTKSFSPNRYPTLAWSAAAQEGARAAAAEPPEAAWWLNYYGPPGALPNHSYLSVLTNDLPAGYFSNKLVVVGMNYDVNVPGLRVDMFASPFGFGVPRFPGVEIQATALLNLVRGDYLRRLPAPLEGLLQLGLAGALGFWLPRLRPAAATLAALAAALGLAILAVWLHRKVHYWWPWLVPIGVQIPVALGWALMFYTLKNRFLESFNGPRPASWDPEPLGPSRRDAGPTLRFMGSSLSLYLSPRLVRRILQRPNLLKLGGTTREVSLMFTDLQGFSKVAERLDPDDLLQFLNRYYKEAIACVHETDGTVIALSGDSIFAVWNAPEDQPQHPEMAGRTALALHARTLELDAQAASPPVPTRVGLHVGRTCVGNIGNVRHLSYTAIGEAVNLTSRLEGANKLLGTGILTSRDFIKATGDKFTNRLLGLFRLKGFHGVIDIYELLGPVEAADDSRVWRDVFQRGVAAFQRRQFAEAEHHFREVLLIRKGDGPARFYLERLPEFRAAELPSDWLGEIELREK
jgi:adenylate cyclase